MKNISLYLSDTSCFVIYIRIRGQRQQLCAPLLLPHLLKRVRQIKRADFFVVLEFQELIAAVARHIDKNVRPIVRKQSLGPWHVGLDSTYSCKAAGIKDKRVVS